ncbi:uncharacterized protein MAL13P1.304-like [Sipha flava]|uniref:Uncharacterized protein MAL13P1.304-like n=1 Tax=Sipha flava TaxID=143950 RepID=A0A8B8F3V6_9HEMI|nr:uncharacterized protein MAL13P1.304-like [Sipha flava]
MASRQSVSSILKPPKVRPPLKEIEPVDPDSDENTASLPKRKVSFSGMNKIKMYNTGATSLTVNQAPMFDEHLSILSDSSNTDKSKLSGKLEKSDGQMILESTNCTNVENNARVIIEYESPSDNMEMTEALSGKILSDTIYTIDNNGSEHFDYNSDYSEYNMEFTEAIKVGQILHADNESDLSSTCMSKTVIDEELSDELMTLSTSKPTSLHNKLEKNTSNISLSNMDFTCANNKSNIMDHSCSNTQSSNMELTCITSKSLKSYWSNNDSKLLSMELTELSDKQTFENNCDLDYDYEYNQNYDTDMEVSHEIETKDAKNSRLLHAKSPKINYSNNQNISSLSKNVKNDEDVLEKLSSSVMSMDVDPSLNENEYDIIYLNVDNSKSIVNEQNNSIVEVENKLDKSNVNDLNYLNNKSKIFMVPTDSSFVQNTSPEKELLEHVPVEILKETFHAHTSVLDQNKYIENKVLMFEEIKEKKYSRRTMKIMPAMTQESMLKSYSRKSIVPTSNLNQTHTCESEDLSNISTTVKENDQDNYSTRLIESISVSDLSHSSKNVADGSAIDKNNEQIVSRKSIIPTSNLNLTQSCENEDLLNISTMVKENNQDNYSTKLIESISDFDLTHSSEDENVADASAVIEETKKKDYSRKTVGPMSLLAQNKFSDDSMCNNSLKSNECYEFNHEKSAASVAQVNINNISSISNNSNIQQFDESNYEGIPISKIEQKSILLNVNEDEFKSPFRKKSKKSVVLTHLTELPIEQLSVKNDNESKLKIDNNSEIIDSINKMDISIELESKDCIKTNVFSEKINLTLPSCSPLNNISHIEKVSNSVNKNQSFVNPPEENIIELEQNVNRLPSDTIFLNNGLNEEKINNKSLKITDNKINNVKHSIDVITSNTCIESIANMSISDDMHYNNEQSFIGNRKRSYSNRDDNIPLSCSTFISKSITHNSIKEDFSKENEVEKNSPIKKDVIKKNIISEESLLDNYIEVDEIEEDFDKEILSNEVMEFLVRWNNQFVENKLTLHKCTNREWIFNVLDNNIVLMITYLPILNDNSFLKVEDISFTIKTTDKTIIPNEVSKFGINWILSKYNPKFYKQICFTSRDVELLLKSLLDDVYFISKAMKNMLYVGDMHCVTFKDSKAQFILHNMNCLLMVRIEILLSNIHKLSVKDIFVDCFFGFFDMKILDEIMKNITRDCNILQSLIEQLKKYYSDEGNHIGVKAITEM